MWGLPLPGQTTARVLVAGSLPLYAVAFSRDRRTVAVGGEGGDVSIWELPTGRRRAVVRGHDAPVRCLAFAPPGAFPDPDPDPDPAGTLISVGYDGKVLAWQVTGNRQLAAVSEPVTGTCALAPTTHGARAGPVWDTSEVPTMAYVDRSAGLTFALARPTRPVWDRWTGQPIATLTDPAGQLRPVAFQPSGGQVAMAGRDRVVRVWRRTDPNEPVTLPYPAPVALVAYSMDGRRLVAADEDGTIGVWDTVRWTRIRVLRDPGLVSATLSPDGTRLAVGEPGSTVMIWNLTTGAGSSIRVDPNQPATALAFSRDGRLLATGGPLQPTRLWTVPDRHLWATLSGSDGTNVLTWAGAGDTVYAIAGTGQVTRWLADPADAIRTICAYLTAAFPGRPTPNCP